MGKELFNPHLNKFSIRKLNVGVCSVLLSTVFLLGTAATVNADETANGSVDDNISLPEKPTESAVSQPVSQPVLENTATSAVSETACPHHQFPQKRIRQFHPLQNPRIE